MALAVAAAVDRDAGGRQTRYRRQQGVRAMTIPKDLVAASATPIVLAILRRTDSYGYAIIQKVREVSENRLAWTDGMLYPVLHRLEAGGLLVSYWQTAATGRKRKYYHLTDAGAEELERQQEHWSVVHSALRRLTEARQRLDESSETGERDV